MTRSVRIAALVGWIAAVSCSRAPEKSLNPEQPDLLRPPEEWLAQEPVRLLRDYVRIDTSASAGELAGAEFLHRFFQCAGITSEIVCPAPRRCNVLARIPGHRREGSLLLLNHIDVASARAEHWTDAPPFEGRIRAGFLYGRGTYDMKSIAIAQALAMRELKRHGIVPLSDVLFLAEADEELGQRWGARWLLDNRPDWFRDIGWVLNEGGANEMILRDVRFWAVETVQAGYANLEFESSDASLLEGLAERWSRLRAPATSPHPHVVLGFDLLANHLGSPLTDPLRHVDRVIRNEEELRILPDRYGSFLEPRIFWSPIYSDPADPGKRARRYAILSLPPGMASAEFASPLRKDAEESGIVIRYALIGEPSVASPYAAETGLVPQMDLLRRVTEAHYPGVPFGPVPTAGSYTTSVLFRSRGIPAYGYTPIPANIFDASRRHGVNERIYLRDYLNGVALYRELLLEVALTP